MQEKRGGRHRYTPYYRRIINVISVSRCPVCGSNLRSRYSRRHLLPLPNPTPDGTHIVWRDCQCLRCGQLRRDESVEHVEAHSKNHSLTSEQT